MDGRTICKPLPLMNWRVTGPWLHSRSASRKTLLRVSFERACSCEVSSWTESKAPRKCRDSSALAFKERTTAGPEPVAAARSRSRAATCLLTSLKMAVTQFQPSFQCHCLTMVISHTIGSPLLWIRTTHAEEGCRNRAALAAFLATSAILRSSQAIPLEHSARDSPVAAPTASATFKAAAEGSWIPVSPGNVERSNCSLKPWLAY
mmetsp:Transcript_83536/g.244903  ORF Transcript_83536/g.244903 Transcript_83536/m.244903 type:complete len:205 (+) Transcript_83536:358-972(+)